MKTFFARLFGLQTAEKADGPAEKPPCAAPHQPTDQKPSEHSRVEERHPPDNQQTPVADPAKASAPDPVQTLGSIFPKPTSIVFRTCRDATNETFGHAVVSLCERYPVISAKTFEGQLNVHVETLIDRKTLACDPASALSRASLDEIAKELPNGGRGGVMVRCLITGTDGNGLHEIAVYWSKKNAQFVRTAIPDCEQFDI